MRSRGLFAVAAILSLASIGRAQSGGGGEPIQLYETYARQDVREDLTPYGVDLLGEQFDLATGTLSFSHIDISIPGNSGLEVAVRRSLNTAMDLFRPSVNEFADWQLEVPRMEMMVAASDGWHLDRCTSASEPDPVFKLGTTFFPFDFWNGLKMIIPGQGSQTVLDSPASPKQPNTQKTTTDYWIISCISDIGGGQGEGFVATSPDGIEYTFDRLRYRTAPPVIKGVALDRNRAQMLATRVEDRFGNWVEYDYSSSGLTISSNDGRTIALTYVPGTQRIGTVTAGGRTWTYGYTIYTGYSYHFLTSVTLPSGQSWSLDLHELVTTPILKELKLHCGILL